MDLEDVELFLRVVDAGSFTRAARTLGLDPSAASRRIAALERHLGVRLLHRTTRAVAATDAGQQFAERVRPSVLALREAEQELRSGEEAVSGTVRLAVPGALGRRRVAPIVFEVLRRHPDLRVDLLISDARVGLVEEAVDLAVRVGVPRDSAWVSRKLGTSPQVFVAAPSFLRDGGLEAPELRVVVRVEGGQAQDPSLLGAPGAIRITLACDDVETAAEAVRAGLGAGLLPEWLVAEAIAAGALVRLPAPLSVPPATWVAVLPAGRQVSRRVRVLLEALVAGFA